MQPQLPKLLLVTRNLPPLLGGMERLNWHMADELAKHYDVRIVGPLGSSALAPQSVSLVVECPHKPIWKFLLFSAWKTIREVLRVKPQVILAGSGLTAPIAYIAARIVRTRCAVYVHGLDVAVRHPLYRLLWLPAIRRIDCVIANSRATRDLALSRGVNPDRISIIHPGVTLPSHLPSQVAIAEFRNKHQLGNRPILLSVGRLTARKGLREFVEQTLPIIVAQQPNALLVIIGEAAKDALHAENQSPESILEQARTLGIESNLRFLGTITDWNELSTAYASASVHVFPIRELKGDPEGFGMVAIEAAAHGVPTVAFSTGGVVDAIAPGESGYLVTLGDYPALAAVVLQVLEGSSFRWEANAMAFARSFAWPAFGNRLRAALRCQ